MIKQMTPVPVYIHACGFHSALGKQNQDIHPLLSCGVNPNMCKNEHLLTDGSSTIIGQVQHNLPSLPSHLSAFDTRNNRLALSALESIESQVQAAIQQYGPSRVAVIVGTSTSGILDGEKALEVFQSDGKFPADYHYEKQELNDCALFIQRYFELNGPCFTVSTACSSSGRAFLSAKRLLKSGLVDAVIVGGADSICRLTLNGFHSLEALSSTLCQPFSAQRNGINIGEAASFMLLTMDSILSDHRSHIALLGAGDSSDAHHISAPHPEGKGAQQAMQKALQDAGLTAHDIGYINAHGTATPLNDRMESKAIAAIFAQSVPVSSTKTLTGHTLGAASAVEAAIAWHILQYDLPLPMQNCVDIADDIHIQLVTKSESLGRKAILSNSFAFGGNNISLIFGYTDD